MAFQFESLNVPDLIFIKPDIYADQRGFFAEIYKYPTFKENGITKPFVQVNHSKSSKNVLRGLHYQKAPMAQAKLVSIIEGEMFDVAVDIRQGSPTFGKWAAVKLDAQKKEMLYIPEGFAHGFCVLSETAQVIYYCTEDYSLEHQRALIWNDPGLGIDWPVADPILSEKDAAAPGIDQADNNFVYKKETQRTV
ncbi:MAG: dTDP-4-dehydrorhamnose 3,5-epimerase [Candidatus Omnitrophica bacterium]|nr:dTDP-4-dehydrorhamnose 3,5-epimerase [Candidatus Omnitrophota bacterium]